MAAGALIAGLANPVLGQGGFFDQLFYTKAEKATDSFNLANLSFEQQKAIRQEKLIMNVIIAIVAMVLILAITLILIRKK